MVSSMLDGTPSTALGLVLDALGEWRSRLGPLTALLLITCVLPVQALNYGFQSHLVAGAFDGVGAGVTLVGWMLYVVFYGAAAVMVGDSAVGPQQAWMRAASRLPGLATIQLVGFLMLLGATFLAVLPPTVVAQVAGMSDDAQTATILTAATLVMLFSLAQLQAGIPAMLLEGTGPYAALKRSWSVTRGRRAAVTGAMAAVLAPNLALSGGSWIAVGGNTVAFQAFWEDPIVLVLSAAVSCVVTPVSAVLTARVLLRLRSPDALVEVFD